MYFSANKKYIRASLFGLFWGLGVSGTSNVWAQNIEADGVVTYGTRRVQARENLAYTLHVLSAEALEKALPRTLPESLSALPGVMVQKTAAGHGSPYIRGFTGNRTLAVIDGVRYNNATYRDGANEYFSHIDIFTLGQVEVLSGPASTLYGSEAVGGTISLQTCDSGYLDQNQEGVFIEGQQIMRLSSGDQSVVSRTMVNFGHAERWGARLGLSVKKFGDVRAQELGRLLHTGYGEHAWDIRLDGKLSDVWSAALVHQNFVQDDVWRTHSTIFAKPFAGTTIGSDQERVKDQSRSLSSVKFKGHTPAPFIDGAEITFSYQPRTESAHRVRANGMVIDQGFSSDLLALNAVFETGLAYANFTYGLDVSHETIESTRTDFDPLTQISQIRIQGPVGDDATYSQTGVFAQSAFDLGAGFGFELGGRWSNVRADIGRFEDPQSHQPIGFAKDWSNFSGSMRGQYRWGDVYRSNLWVAVSESFRAPNIADISRFGRSRSNEFEVASTSLKPENFLTGEIGYKLASDRFHLSASYYYTDMQDYIDTVPTGRMVGDMFEVSKRNSSQGHVQGVELGIDVELSEGLSLTSHVTWLEGRVSRPVIGGGVLTEPISRIMPLSGYASLNWSYDDIWVKGELSLVGKADRLSAGDREDTQRIPIGGTPAYSLLNLQMGWDMSAQVRWTLSANNLLDQAYRVHGSGSNEAGRHIVVGLNLSF